MFPEGRALEFLIAAVVALIVVGPKDLPILLRKFGQFMAKVRSMAAEFRASFDEMARQSELDELRKEVEAMRQGQLADMATHAPEVSQTFNEISQGLSDVGVQLNNPAGYYDPAAQTSHVEISTAPKSPTRKTGTRKTAASKAVKGKAAAKAPVKAVAAKKAPAPRTAKAAAAKTASAAKPAPAKTPPAKAPVKAPVKAAAKPRARKATVS